MDPRRCIRNGFANGYIIGFIILLFISFLRPLASTWLDPYSTYILHLPSNRPPCGGIYPRSIAFVDFVQHHYCTYHIEVRCHLCHRQSLLYSERSHVRPPLPHAWRATCALVAHPLEFYLYLATIWWYIWDWYMSPVKTHRQNAKNVSRILLVQLYTYICMAARGGQ